MSLQALNTALTGLRVAQQQLNVLSNNVANVGTPGYTRKILPQSAVALSNGHGIGVAADTVIRKVDMNLSRDLWTQISSVSANNIRASYLSSIETFHGPPDKELSISAYIAALKDQFIQLSDDPANGFSLQATLNQAHNVADKFNSYGKMITQMRQDIQGEIGAVVETVNSLAQQIADLNRQIKSATSLNRSTADLEDRRDEALKKMSEEIQITYFTRSDGVITVQTVTGVEIASDTVSPLYFTATNASPEATYPGSLSGIFTNGPQGTPSAFDITRTKLGGKLGSLLELRDDTLMQYQAQMDELAHKLALRFDAQGLRLFTDASGRIPDDTPPDPSANPPVSVTYVGFASNIRVNSAIVDNIELLQQGTYTAEKPIPSGSDAVIRRILDFTFGMVDHQQAAGTINLDHTAFATDLQQWLGLSSSNTLTGRIDLSAYPQIDDGIAGNGVDLADMLADLIPGWPADDQVDITFTDPRTGLPDTTITLDLSAASLQAGPGINDALDQIIAEINAQITAAGVPPEFSALASRNNAGQLVLSSRSHIHIDASGAGGMGTEALEAFGLREGSFATTDPYFDIQIDDRNPVRIHIAPGDDINTLLDKMRWDPVNETGVQGLNVSFDAATGFITLRPGMDESNGGPAYGGSLRLTSGSFYTDTAAAQSPDISGLPQGVNILSALFGNFTVNGGTITEHSPISDVFYGSETVAGSGIFVPYRTQHLGAGVNIGTNILTATNIIDYGQKIINRQTQDLVRTQNAQSDETTLRDLLQRRLLDGSAVNIDEEMSHLIVVQTAYAAAARAVTAADAMFQELLSIFR